MGDTRDWHELTAFYGLAHAETLAVVMPHLYRYTRQEKSEKLAQYGRRVWQLDGDKDSIITSAIEHMEGFFHSIRMPTKLDRLWR